MFNADDAFELTIKEHCEEIKRLNYKEEAIQKICSDGISSQQRKGNTSESYPSTRTSSMDISSFSSTPLPLLKFPRHVTNPETSTLLESNTHLEAQRVNRSKNSGFFAICFTTIMTFVVFLFMFLIFFLLTSRT